MGQAKDLFLTASETDNEHRYIANTGTFVPITIAPKNSTPYKIFTQQNKGYVVFQNGVYQYDGNSFIAIPNINRGGTYRKVNGGKDFLMKQDTSFLLSAGAIYITASGYKKE
ncbi:hypothetical protein [Niabella ginsengisoli]|uniref:Uncharacterized protein n=1 Tax=Niabella ginsengisoli TaxID=522298 RepID=A0ABS9SQ75_9BACT|nr:hypothetical protein [Niabella ginsengisoli]MCH5600554.1 hypothetical protein [Niabella ginsengisoli]